MKLSTFFGVLFLLTVFSTQVILYRNVEAKCGANVIPNVRGVTSVGVGVSIFDTAVATAVGMTKCKMCHIQNFKSLSLLLTDTTGTIMLTTDTTKAMSVIRPRHCDCVDTDCKCENVRGCNCAQGSFRSKLSCETCHGFGSLHVALPASNQNTTTRRNTINRTENTCKSCHIGHQRR